MNGPTTEAASIMPSHVLAPGSGRRLLSGRRTGSTLPNRVFKGRRSGLTMPRSVGGTERFYSHRSAKAAVEQIG